MEFNKFLELLNFNKEEINILENTNIDFLACLDDTLNNLTSDLETSIKEENKLKEILKDDTLGLQMLKVMLLASLKSYKKYQKQNIDENIFIDTFKVFKRFTDEYRSYSNNVFGFDRSFWTVRQLTLNLFRIGTLEFEFGKTPDNKNEIAVHIPSDANMEPAKIDESFNNLKVFLNKYYPDYKYERICLTCWMLSPCLSRLLPKESKIIQFQNRFNVIDTFESTEYIEWIYNNQKCEIKDLKCSTSLQVKLKQYLLKGNKFYEGFGILK